MPETIPPKVAVLVEEPFEMVKAEAQQLASRLNLPVIRCADREYSMLLTVTDRRLELRFPQEPKSHPLYVDFIGGKMGYRRRVNRSGLIYRAIDPTGIKPTVIDATAGLAQDAFLLALYGCRITAIERSSILCALVEDGIRRACKVSELATLFEENFNLIQGDSVEILKNRTLIGKPEIIYLDPMFPPKKKNALVKKEMRILRQLVGDDQDSEKLLEISRTVASRHVTVKRMRHAPFLGDTPIRSYTGKVARYDIYSGNA